MLQIFQRATRVICPLTQATTNKTTAAVAIFQRPYASFTARDLFNETSDESGTLLLHFAKHIAMAGALKDAPLVPTKIRYPDYFPVTDMHIFQQELRRTEADQLPFLIIFASTYRSNADPTKFVRVLNDLDAAAVNLLPTMDDETTLRTLYALLFLLPNWLTRTDFYRAAVRRLVEQSSLADDMSKEKFVQLCFYLGLAKKQSGAQRNAPLLPQLLEQQLAQHLEQLSGMDLAVVASAAYKTSSQVQNAAYGQRLVAEVNALPLDIGAYDALLVTYIKALRFQRVRSTEVCERLATLCTKTQALRQLQPQGLVHIFAYFAENLWDQSECMEVLTTEFMRRLGASNKRFQSDAMQLRTKDIAIFLWCCAHLNAPLTAAQLQRLEAVLLEKVQNNDYRYLPDQLVDSTLSLWSLGHRSRDLLQQTVEAKSQATRVSFGKQQREQPKVESRLTVLLSAAAIEEPTWTSNIGQMAIPFNSAATAPAYLLKARADLCQYAAQLKSEEGIAESKLICPITGINIPGLQVQFDAEEANNASPLFVELLNFEQTLRFSEEPISIVRLKTRLLEALGHKVVVLRPHDLLSENYTSLKAIAEGGETSDDSKAKEQSVRSI